jgi:hypothetical protein
MTRPKTVADVRLMLKGQWPPVPAYPEDPPEAKKVETSGPVAPASVPDKFPEPKAKK